jgi:hypothetical protein
MDNVAVERSRNQRGRRNARQPSRKNAAVLDPFGGSGVTFVRQETPRKTKVDITPLIKFATELQEGPLKAVLLSEINDEIDVLTFLARYPVWLRLARLKKT